MEHTRDCSAPALMAEATIEQVVLLLSKDSMRSCNAEPAVPNKNRAIAPTPLSLSRNPDTAAASSFDCVSAVNAACSAPLYPPSGAQGGLTSIANAVSAYNTGCKVWLKGELDAGGLVIASSACESTARTATVSAGLARAVGLDATNKKMVSVAKARSARGNVEIGKMPPDASSTVWRPGGALDSVESCTATNNLQNFLFYFSRRVGRGLSLLCRRVPVYSCGLLPYWL